MRRFNEEEIAEGKERIPYFVCLKRESIRVLGFGFQKKWGKYK